MNNLIINGIDHGKFDLEWAKRGGVVFYDGEFCRYLNSGDDLFLICPIYEFAPRPISFEIVDIMDIIRMATPSECAEAGIEYIEPPARWLSIETMQADIDSLEAQLADARKDSYRLDWIIKQSEVVVLGANTSEINYVDAYFIDASFKRLAYGNNPRDAIDNAMKVGE